MSQKVINREDIDLLFVSTMSDGFDKLFIVYYVTTNDINFYRMNYPIDSILSERLNDSTFSVNDFIIGLIERRHDLNKKLTFEELDVKLASWGQISHEKAINYHKQQTREIKINQII